MQVRDGHTPLTPLCYACLKKRPGTVRVLIEGVVDVDRKDRDGITPLIYACGYPSLDAFAHAHKFEVYLIFQGSPECIRLLIENGADVNMQSDGLAQRFVDEKVDVIRFRKTTPLAVAECSDSDCKHRNRPCNDLVKLLRTYGAENEPHNK